MDELQELVTQIELHSVEGIRRHFANGIDPNGLYKGQPLFHMLVSMYTRTPRLKQCVQAFVDFGLEIEDNVLLSALLDDAASLDALIKSDPSLVSKKYSLPSAYTPLDKVSLLHICAEFNHLSCIKVLVQHGADTNSKGGEDEYGFGGQTPIFHTVNQNENASAESMHYLLSQSADLSVTVKGIIWGKNQEWETLVPAVNPISYAMMGLLPQMHRNEKTISEVVSVLLKHAYGINYAPRNIPCAYLTKA